LSSDKFGESDFKDFNVDWAAGGEGGNARRFAPWDAVHYLGLHHVEGRTILKV
jgi:hypothetical protein